MLKVEIIDVTVCHFPVRLLVRSDGAGAGIKTLPCWYCYRYGISEKVSTHASLYVRINHILLTLFIGSLLCNFVAKISLILLI